MLLLGTVFWGCGFTWGKAAIVTLNRGAGAPDSALFGPILSLALRFTVATILWPIFFPAALRGWTRRGAARCVGVGLLLAASLVLQLVGLGRTSEAVNAFLTSLTVLFVPLILTVALRRPPRPVLWIGVALASAGVWLMTGAQPGGFGSGELLGLGCALGFSIYILAVNAAAELDDPWRLSFGQFLVVAIVCDTMTALAPGSAVVLKPLKLLHLLLLPGAGLNLAFLSLLTTMAAFGLLTHYQPKLEPTRATLIYLMEPVIATVYAGIAARHGLGGSAIFGAALILLANLAVELILSRESTSWSSAAMTRAEPPAILPNRIERT